MKKKIIHGAVLALIFVIAVIVFEYMTSRGNDNMMEDLGNATLPRVSFTAGDYSVNPVTGYVEEMDAASMRDTITPVTNQKLTMNVEADGAQVDSAVYEVYTLDGEERLYRDTVSEVSEKVRLNFGDTDLTEERLLIVTLHAEGKDVRYYTRIVEPTDFHLTDCLDYVYDFHENALAKKENVGVGAALDPTDDEDNTNFAHVTIHSSYDQVTWGDLEPQVTGGERWKIVETNETYTSVLLEYDVNCTGEENETDLYTVREFFRVRMSSGTMYLLDYDRTMEQMFDGSKKVLSEKGVLLGITSSDVPYRVNSDGNIVAFVQANELWNYNRDQDELSLLFSFRDTENTDDRNKVSDHSIRILDMDKDGNTTFAVTGYMNRGSHEGRVGVAIYYYDIQAGSIEEKAFVSSNKSASVAEEELCKLTYYSTKSGNLYMMADGTLHEIDVSSNWDEELVSGLKEDQYVISDSGKWIAWQNGSSLEDSGQVTVKNLYNGKEYTVDAGQGESIVPLGFVDNDFVYGLAKKSDTGKTVSGETTAPMYRLEIRNSKSKVVKTYEAEETYVLGVQISDGLITLSRAKKSGDTYTAVAADYISSNSGKSESNIMLESYVTDLKETQMRLTFADGISDQTAKVLKPKQVRSDEPALPSFGKETDSQGYYVYGLGSLQGIYKEAGEAIRKADDVSGVVVTAAGQYVWERGNRYLVSQVSGKDEILESLQSQLKDGTSALEAADGVSDGQGMELTGCSAEELLYLIDQGTYVIGVEEDGTEIILTGYTKTTVTYLNVTDGQSQTVTLEAMDTMMESGGKVYVGYLP